MESFFAQMPDDLASAQWYRSSSGPAGAHDEHGAMAARS